MKRMTKQQVLDIYFLDARSKLIDIAAFLDRLLQAEGEGDFRSTAFRKALQELENKDPDAAKRILEVLSDPTTDPIESAQGMKGAMGAWGKSGK